MEEDFDYHVDSDLKYLDANEELENSACESGEMGSHSLVEVPTPMGVEVYTIKYFRTDMRFESREVLIDYARKVGRKLDIVMVVTRSDINDGNRTPRVLLNCERSGKYRQMNGLTHKRKSTTKKCNCPFTLKGHMSVDKKWLLYVANGKHNHQLARNLEGHAFVGRLSEEERATVIRLCRTGMRSRDILTHLKQSDPNNVSTLKTIYNVRGALRLKETEGKSHMQQLFHLLVTNGFVVKHRSEGTTEVIKDLFFCSSSSIELAKTFPFVFMLDCTYKTNKYRLPLLQIVGVTSTLKTFSVAFCYMSLEREDNHEWALGCFKSVFDELMISVFICDRELALMKALKTVFPESKNLLCRVHITKNVLTNCISGFKVRADFDEFMKTFSTVILSPTVHSFDVNLSVLNSNFNNFPQALEYVNEWFSKYKTYFVAAYVDQYLHLGNTTTNRVEGSHSKLKKFLSTSVGGCVQSFKQISLLLEGQFTEIKSSFEYSLTRVPIRFRTFLYKELVNVVSSSALEKIETELTSCGVGRLGIECCTHATLLSLGLPYAHMMSQYRETGTSIPLSDVHSFWKKLSLEPFKETGKTEEVTLDMEFELLKKTFNAATLPQKMEIKRKLQAIGKPSTTSVLEPKQKTTNRGRPKGRSNFKASQEMSTQRTPSAFEFAQRAHVFEEEGLPQTSQTKPPAKKGKKVAMSKTYRTRCSQDLSAQFNRWLPQFPAFFHPYIANIIDVPGDGHCGFRVIASFFGWDTNEWRRVRQDMLVELQKQAAFHDKMFQPITSTKELIESVDCYDEKVDKKSWLIMPYMGNVISTCYNVVVLLISKGQCLTFFPLKTQ